MKCCICNDDIWHGEESVLVGDDGDEVAHRECADEAGVEGE